MRADRVFLIVLDSLGAGESPDASDFGDVGAHTLRSLYNTGKLRIPNLVELGIGNIDGLDFLGTNDKLIATIARLKELSGGKDTTIGHWEICGNAQVVIKGLFLTRSQFHVPVDRCARFSTLEIGVR